MSSTDFDDQLANLRSSLLNTIAMLRDHGERRWLSWAERCLGELDAHDAVVFDHVLGAYGAMGSFNDLLMLGWNGHTIQLDQEDAVNRRLADLRTAIWTAATALRREVW